MQKFTVTSPVTAVIDMPAGRVQLIAADRADVTVDVRPASSSSSRDVRAAEQVSVGYADGAVRVEASPAAHRVLGSSGAVEVTVQLPTGSRAQVKTASAEVRTVGRLGDVTVEAPQAIVKVDEAATARVSVQDGDVTIGRLHGDADIRTSKGDIQVAEAVSGTLTLHTQLGSITADAAAGTSATLDAGTPYGRISNALKNAGGSPALTIHATTAYGDITARSR